MSTRPGGIVRLLALVGSEVAALWTLWRLGAWTGGVPLHDPGGWLATTPLETAVGALVRLAALVGGTWLLGTTVLSIAAELPGIRVLRPFARRLSLPLVRRLVEGAFAVSIGITSMTGPAFAATPTRPTAITVTAAPVTPTVQLSTTRLVRVAARLPAATPAAVADASCEVQAGDSLWRIAQRRLGSGNRYVDLWRANKGRVLGGKAFTNPNLIHPGWVLILPDAVASSDPPLASPPPTGEPAVTADPSDAADPAPAAPSDTATAIAPTETTSPALPVTDPPVTAAPATPSTTPAPTVEPLHPMPRADTITVSPHASTDPIRIALGVGLIASLAIAGTTMLGRKALRPRPASAPPAPVQPRSEEQRLRAIADDEAAAWIDATLRLLTSACGLKPSDAPPPIRLVRAGHLGVEVLLDDPRPIPPPGFTADAEGWIWRVDPDLTLAAARARADRAGPLSPATVPIGATPDGVALIDLEHVRRLSIVGPHDLTNRSITEIATSLATAPWAKGCELLSLDLDLPECLGVTPLADLAAAREAIGMAHFQAGATMADGAPTTAAARCADPSREDAPPAVLLIGRALTAAEADLLEQLAPAGGHGVAIVSITSLQHAEWVLSIAADGRARLAPLDLDLVLTPADVSDATVAALAPLAERAVSLVADDDPGPVLAPLVDEAAVALTVISPSPAEPQPSGRGAELTVLVLGPLAIQGAEVSPRSARMDCQLLVRLAYEGGPMTLDALRQDLYVDGTATDNTLGSAIKRARKRFGLDRDGAPFIGPVKYGSISLTGNIDADLHAFRRRTAQPGGDIEALRLIRGEPFSDLPGSYDWVDAGLVYRIQTEIVPVADRASATAYEAGDLDLARWAAEQGLLAAPDHEGLRVRRARAEAAAGDRNALRRTINEIEDVASELDAQPLPETLHVIEQLLAGLDASRDRRRAS